MRKITAGIAAASAVALSAGALAPAAMAADGTKSLASVLTAKKLNFDKNGSDFDILTYAVLRVLKEKPDSAVKVLTDGTTALTAFVPNDQAFRILAEDLTGKHLRTEGEVYKAVLSLGVDTVETVLLYHVVPGATVTSTQAVKANNAVLTTAQGGTFTVRVTKIEGTSTILLLDKDKNSRNPRVIVADVNKGNKQIAHGIDRVLRPLDLPPAAE